RDSRNAPRSFGNTRAGEPLASFIAKPDSVHAGRRAGGARGRAAGGRWLAVPQFPGTRPRFSRLRSEKRADLSHEHVLGRNSGSESTLAAFGTNPGGSALRPGRRNRVHGGLAPG